MFARATASQRSRRLWGGAAILFVAGVLALLALTHPVPVPKLIGLTRPQAQKKVTDAGFVLVVKGTVLSADIPKGAIASQDPTAGVTLRSGSLVVVLLSAGPGTFATPNVLGMTLDQASTILRQRGLVVEVDTEPSVAPSGTIVDSVPAAGELVQSGDTVHLTVATNASLSVSADLSGTSFVLDPAPPEFLSGKDVSFDVASRVAELLRLAGASVTLTRGALGSSNMPGVSSRAASARAEDATAVIGFSVGSDSVGGIQVGGVPSSESSIAPGGSGLLADSITTALLADIPNVVTTSLASDPVLTGAGRPAVRIRLGSSAVAADAASFADDDWAQRVAHDVYMSLATMFGRVSP